MANLISRLVRAYCGVNIVLRILCGLVVGIVLACAFPGCRAIGLLGVLFVGTLKAIAPILVALLVTSSLASGSLGLNRKFGLVLFLYLLATFLAALIAVCGSFMFPQTLVLQTAEADLTAPCGLAGVFSNLLTKMTENPIAAVANANYLGVLFWSVFAGLVLKRSAGPQFKAALATLADAVSRMVRVVIDCAPFGILGIAFTVVSNNGIGALGAYASLVALLVGCMAFVALVMNPAIIFAVTRRNPYPLVFTCLQRSGMTAFFTRSSAANIPVNMQLCRDLGLDADLYSVSIPLGATVNMSGAAVTITVMTLAAANTVGVRPDVMSALLLSVLASLAACGASGVAGGSMLLIPLACSLFGIGNDIAMQVVGAGFFIGIVQDGVETMLNSSSDVMFAAAAELRYRGWGKSALKA